MSGSRRTKLVPSRYRSAYFPRSLPFRSSRRSYSGFRSSSSSSFFIGLFLGASQLPSTDEADPISPLCMGHDEEPFPARASYRQVSGFLARMGRAGDRLAEGISKK